MSRRWSVVVPVKDASVGKSRLSAYAAARPTLARALALDTLDAVAGCPVVARVIVVTSDETLAAASSTSAYEVVPDPGGGLGAAIIAGLAKAGGGGAPVAVLTADLPALTSDELAAALRLAEAYPLSVVADADGTGTTLLAATDVHRLEPRFGAGSLAAHLAQGATPLPAGRGLQRDTDLPEHLAALGTALGPRTTAVLARVTVR
ncbi:2-phospho-L-lactate guanylyltransferase [Mumia sp. ZJ430]|uniref:2-phospho-L-lactate guanylyltransferase n=1 Tax=Mumia sp. ZJ430 TaxID=2708083 RepID=UPI0014225D26|nr:2-phospho-L-lactate guanylyltransferase [Mumia sp. ZJ430]